MYTHSSERSFEKSEGTPLVRQPAFAGSFYPAAPEELKRSLATFLGPTEFTRKTLQSPMALIVPHAGYSYSGRTAGIAFSEFRVSEDANDLNDANNAKAAEESDEKIERVVVIGPSHRVPLKGLALPGCDAFETPLGSIPVDRELS